MSQPSILVLGAFPPPGEGSRTPSEELARRLRDAGWAVRISSRSRSVLRRPTGIIATALLARRSTVALVDLYSGRAWLWGAVAVRLLAVRRIPVVLALHGGGLAELALQQPARFAATLGRAAAVVAPSPFLSGVASRAGVGADIEEIPNALDLPHHPAADPGPPARPAIVWLRAFHEVYRPWIAIEVLARVRRRHPGARLSMVGPDKGDGSLERCRERLAALDLGEAVEILGPVAKADVPEALRRGDVFLNTSALDNAPVSVIEAMACGLAVVSTDAGGLPSLLEDGVDALLAPVDDADALADRVLRILDDPSLAARVRTTALERSAARDWSVVLPRWQALFRRVSGT